MMFPGPGAQIYRNDAGEVVGWDYPDDDDARDLNRFQEMADVACEEAYERGQEDAEEGLGADPSYGTKRFPGDAAAAQWLQDSYGQGYADGGEVSSW